MLRARESDFDSERCNSAVNPQTPGRQPAEDDTDYFSELIDDCVLEIFDRLPLNDLCAMNRANRKLQRLSERHFVRRYPKLMRKPISIIYNSRHIFIDNSEKYVECFTRQLESFEITSKDYGNQGYGMLLEFMKAKCSKSIKWIHFHDVKWSEEFQNGMEDILQTVETVRLENSCDNLRIDEFVRQLPELKRLEIDSDTTIAAAGDWLNIKCPKLETFIWHVEFSPMEGIAENVLKQNPTIKHFKYCLFFEWSARILKTVLECENIDKLYIRLDDTQLLTILPDLKMLSKRNLRGIGVSMSEKDLANCKFTATHSIEPITELYLFDVDDLDYVSFDLWTNLQILTIDFAEYDVAIERSDAVEWAKKLENLSRFRFRGYYRTFLRMLDPLVRYCPKLMKIRVDEELVRAKHFDLPALNASRNSLENAVKLTIYIKPFDVAANRAAVRQNEIFDMVELIVRS